MLTPFETVCCNEIFPTWKIKEYDNGPRFLLINISHQLLGKGVKFGRHPYPSIIFFYDGYVSKTTHRMTFDIYFCPPFFFVITFMPPKSCLVPPFRQSIHQKNLHKPIVYWGSSWPKCWLVLARYQQLHPPLPFATYAPYFLFFSPKEGWTVIHLWFGLVKSSIHILCIWNNVYKYIETSY